MNRNTGFGFVGLALSGAYITATQTIRSPAFGDVVGSAGLPTVLGWALAGLSLLLIITCISQRDASPATGEQEPADEDFADPVRAWLRGLGVVGCAIGYILVLPILGYIPAITLLLAGTAIYFGAPKTWRMGAICLAGGVLLWAMFGLALQVRLPGGLLLPPV